MSPDDLPSSADSSPEAEPTLPLVESTFQPTLAETHGEETTRAIGQYYGITL